MDIRLASEGVNRTAVMFFFFFSGVGGVEDVWFES